MQTACASINNNEDIELPLKIIDDSAMVPSHLQYYAQSTANNSEDQNRRSKGTHFISIHVTNQINEIL